MNFVIKIISNNYLTYSVNAIYIELSKLQKLHISALEMDVHVAFPVADIISLAVVLVHYQTANRNVIIANTARAIAQ